MIKNSSNSNIKKRNEGKLNKTKKKFPDNVLMTLTQCAEVGDPPFHTQ